MNETRKLAAILASASAGYSRLMGADEAGAANLLRERRRRRGIPSLDAGKSVGVPVFAADAMVEEEETVGIVFVLHRAKACVVLPPEGVLPVRLEEVGLPHIGPVARQELAEFVHRLLHRFGLAPGRRFVRLMARDARIGGLSEGGADRQSESVRNRWIHRRI